MLAMLSPVDESGLGLGTSRPGYILVDLAGLLWLKLADLQAKPSFFSHANLYVAYRNRNNKLLIYVFILKYLSYISLNI